MRVIILLRIEECMYRMPSSEVHVFAGYPGILPAPCYNPVFCNLLRNLPPEWLIMITDGQININRFILNPAGSNG